MSTTGPSSKTSGIPSGDSLTSALARLNSALDGLDKAADLALEKKDIVQDSDAEIQSMAEDRAKLAQELDDSEARAKRLGDVNSEVSRRLVGAMETVRAVMERSS